MVVGGAVVVTAVILALNPLRSGPWEEPAWKTSLASLDDVLMGLGRVKSQISLNELAPLSSPS